MEETPKGWFMTYIDRDSETLLKDKLKSKRISADLVEEEKQERLIAKQIERALSQQQQQQISEIPQTQEKLEENSSGKVAFSLGGKVGSNSVPQSAPILEDETEGEKISKKARTSSGVSSGGFSALDELMKEEEKAKERSNRKDYWLCEGIVVKVMSKALAEKGYYKQKGVVVKVIDKYVGEIEMLEKKHVLRIDQEELETVIPLIGGLVRVVNGAYRGSNARLISVNTEKFCAKVQIEKGIYDGRVLSAVDYEDISKIHQSS